MLTTPVMFDAAYVPLGEYDKETELVVCLFYFIVCVCGGGGGGQ